MTGYPALGSVACSRVANAGPISRRRVAFVIQRCGTEVNGGAEALCLKVAQRMSQYWDVEVLTTCALDYVTWENHFPAGLETVEGARIRRFVVAESRDIDNF